MNKLYFKCKGSTKDVNFNEYHDSRQWNNGIKKQKKYIQWCSKKSKTVIKKINEVKIGKKFLNKKK